MTATTIPETWRATLEPVLASRPLRTLGGFLKAEEAAGKTIYPPAGSRLAALALAPLPAVKVVILGQDPYHGSGQAHGLAFSVPRGTRVPPSLLNIFKEQEADLGLPRPAHGHLESWARQGVLLLNTVLTVEAGQAASHQGRGWELFTDAAILAVAERPTPCVFLLWGSQARAKASLIKTASGSSNWGPHLILEAPHPSPLSAHRGFLGCGHFSRTNAFLAEQGSPPIDWGLPP
ncbi:MAG: uracil-DNA glycosylase [Novosphingobium sp.]